jgi:hypothetical protein
LGKPYPKTSRGHLLQYIDDLLLCGSTEPLVSRVTESPLNFLASRGYKVSRKKAQLCLLWVTYLGTIHKGQTRSLSPAWIKPAVSLFGGHWMLSYLDSGICRLSQALISASFLFRAISPPSPNFHPLLLQPLATRQKLFCPYL